MRAARLGIPIPALEYPVAAAAVGAMGITIPPAPGAVGAIGIMRGIVEIDP
jgi:hypothetical protein